MLRVLLREQPPQIGFLLCTAGGSPSQPVTIISVKSSGVAVAQDDRDTLEAERGADALARGAGDALA